GRIRRFIATRSPRPSTSSAFLPTRLLGATRSRRAIPSHDAIILWFGRTPRFVAIQLPTIGEGCEEVCKVCCTVHDRLVRRIAAEYVVIWDKAGIDRRVPILVA